MIKYVIKGTEFSVWASTQRAAEIDQACDPDKQRDPAEPLSVYTSPEGGSLAWIPPAWLERADATQPPPDVPGLYEQDRELIDRAAEALDKAGSQLDRGGRAQGVLG